MWLITFILISAITFLPTISVFAAADAVSSAAGLNHSLILKGDGTVWAWGNNDYGKLGDGTTSQRGVPVKVKDLTNITRISAGSNHSLALKSDGTVWTWGKGDYGQLGNNTTTNNSTPVQVSSLTNVIAIAGGGDYSLALKSDGTVWAWGSGAYGQMGNGGTQNVNRVPTQVSGLTDVIAIAAGVFHNLAVKKDGSVYAWGYGYWNQLGTGNSSNQTYPVKLTNLVNIIGVAAGEYNSYAFDADGKVFAWGYQHTSTPSSFGGLTDVVEISNGKGNHTLALTKDGSVYAWGSNSQGQLGNGNTVSDFKQPQLISNIKK